MGPSCVVDPPNAVFFSPKIQDEAPLEEMIGCQRICVDPLGCGWGLDCSKDRFRPPVSPGALLLTVFA